MSAYSCIGLMVGLLVAGGIGVLNAITPRKYLPRLIAAQAMALVAIVMLLMWLLVEGPPV